MVNFDLLRHEENSRPRDTPVFFVYMLILKDKSVYVGYTNELHRRIFQHIKGWGVKATKEFRPLKFVYYERHKLKVVALAREKELIARSDEYKYCLITDFQWEVRELGKIFSPATKLVRYVQ